MSLLSLMLRGISYKTIEICNVVSQCVCQSQKVTDNNIKTIAYFAICPFYVQYKSVMFYSTGPWYNMLECLSLSRILSLAYCAPCFTPGPNVIKLFTTVIYRHSMIIQSFCFTKQHYLGNYCRIAVNYHSNIYNIEFTLK